MNINTHILNRLLSDCRYLLLNFYAKILLLTTANVDILANQAYQLALYLIFSLLEHTLTPKK